MTGPDHFRKAEELTEKAHEYLGQGDGQENAAVWAAVAQIHPTLASLLPPRSGQPLKAAPGPMSLAPSSRQAAPNRRTVDWGRNFLRLRRA